MDFIKNDCLGWCPEDKQKKLYEYSKNKKLCVEVGVYGGSSLVPIALGCDGLVIGIDPWDNNEAVKNMDDIKEQEHLKWWSKIDLLNIKNKYYEDLKKYEVDKKVITLELTSEQAKNVLSEESIDLLHIDGNHTEISSCRDVEIWCPKLKKGGILFFDDTHWETVKKAVSNLKNHNIELLEDFICWQIYIKK